LRLKAKICKHGIKLNDCEPCRKKRARDYYHANRNSDLADEKLEKEKKIAKLLERAYDYWR